LSLLPPNLFYQKTTKRENGGTELSARLALQKAPPRAPSFSIRQGPVCSIDTVLPWEMPSFLQASFEGSPPTKQHTKFIPSEKHSIPNTKINVGILPKLTCNQRLPIVLFL